MKIEYVRARILMIKYRNGILWSMEQVVLPVYDMDGYQAISYQRMMFLVERDAYGEWYCRIDYRTGE